MRLEENYDLTKLNTFGIAQQARYFARFSTIDDLKKLIEVATELGLDIFCLGGGSNVLITNPFNGLVIRNEMMGVELIQETSEQVHLKVGAGVVWPQFVNDCVEKEWGGVENLSLIPGTVGAAPIQNIGAYGVEVKEVISAVHVFDLHHLREMRLNPTVCRFGYRDSVFKHIGKNRWIITAVEFTLSKNPLLRTQYGAIENELKKMQVTVPTIKEVAQAVTHIRQSKLPDPALLGNAGSFFKNPIIPNKQYEQLKKLNSTIVAFPDRDGYKKVAAGWLIEAVGLKGYTEGPCGVHQEQALVIVNYGGATGQNILNLAEKIKSLVFKKFQIELEIEVNIL